MQASEGFWTGFYKMSHEIFLYLGAVHLLHLTVTIFAYECSLIIISMRIAETCQRFSSILPHLPDAFFQFSELIEQIRPLSRLSANMSLLLNSIVVIFLENVPTLKY